MVRTRPPGLRSAGEGGKRQNRTDWDLLTPRELHIAHVAVEGLSNKEIGRQLHLSPRMIGAHLYRVFPKPGIASRGQLRDKLSASGACPSCPRARLLSLTAQLE
ncbi:response regulator transcription factor [Streptomyces sp. KR55]|uniref:response regulator transcription factor n=1 Tax=Streptomyces sp. KR55 TaxID=3457425 RepID=UPI003FD1AFE1